MTFNLSLAGELGEDYWGRHTRCLIKWLNRQTCIEEERDMMFTKVRGREEVDWHEIGRVRGEGYGVHQ